MKLKLTTALAFLPLGAFAATNVAFQNFSGATTGFPVVDNLGAPIASGNLSIAVGTFTEEFAATLGSLDTLTSDAAVVAAFQQTGTSRFADPLSLEGLFNTAVADADNGNSLAGQSAFLLITDTSAATAQVIVFDLGAAFPTQNSAGAGSIPSRQLGATDVAFGFVGNDGTGVAVDTTSLAAKNPGFGAGGFAKGVTFDTAIPEPSTSLLAGLAGLALVARRRR